MHLPIRWLSLRSSLRLLAGLAASLSLLAGAPSPAAPIEPSSDDEVIEVLPPVPGSRAEERRLRKSLAARPTDLTLALSLARRYLDRAHELGDPRFAGMALAAIAAWKGDARAPDDVLMMQATLEQYVHEFDASVATLRRLLERPTSKPRPQPWLTLATVLRVQGRYAESDAACAEVIRNGTKLHGEACLAENAGLRGEFDRARAAFKQLAATPGLAPATLGWLATSLAELEQRAGRPTAADAAYRAALQIQPDTYAALAYADLLIEQGRPGEALQALAREYRSDAVVLRLAIAGRQAKAATAAADIADMRERIVLANERPEAKSFHGREQAMFALWIDGDAARALALARGNVERQREPLDLLVYAQAARASGEREALRRAERLTRDIGLRDRRIDALLG